MVRVYRWFVLAATWGLARALLAKVGTYRWGLGPEFLVDLAVVPLVQLFAVGPFLKPSRSGPVGVALRLFVPLFFLHLVGTAGIASLFRHVDLRPHTIAGLLAIPLLQAAVLASLVPKPAPAVPVERPPGERRTEAVLALLLLLLVAALLADVAFGWYGPLLVRLTPTWPPPLRGLAGYGAPAVAALGFLLALRARHGAEPVVARLLDASAAVFLATLVGAFGQFYQRPFLVRPWSTLLPAGLWLSVVALLAALALAAARAKSRR